MENANSVVYIFHILGQIFPDKILSLTHARQDSQYVQGVS